MTRKSHSSEHKNTAHELFTRISIRRTKPFNLMTYMVDVCQHHAKHTWTQSITFDLAKKKKVILSNLFCCDAGDTRWTIRKKKLVWELCTRMADAFSNLLCIIARFEWVGNDTARTYTFTTIIIYDYRIIIVIGKRIYTSHNVYYMFAVWTRCSQIENRYCSMAAFW